MYQKFLKPLAKDVFGFVMDILFPVSCITCGAEGNFICAGCAGDLKKVSGQVCIACRKAAALGITHPGCATPHGADGLISAFNYHDERVAEIIIQGKYSLLPEVYQILSEIISNQIKKDYPYLLNTGNYNLVPIPLHSWRKRWRGFNQAEIICRGLSSRLGWPITEVLTRTRNTKVQKNLNREQRAQNMAGCFTLKKGANVRGKEYIIVDDVVTTGVTLLEAAKILKRNGAAKVWCLTIARD